MLNNVNLQGRLTADPELKKTPSGVSVTTFKLAVDRNYQSNGERETDFPAIVAWRGTAEFICRNFTKGKMIIVNGSIQTRTYKAQDGSNRYATEVVADNVYFAGDKKEQAATGVSGGYGANTYATPNAGATSFAELSEDDGELPF